VKDVEVVEKKEKAVEVDTAAAMASGAGVDLSTTTAPDASLLDLQDTATDSKAGNGTTDLLGVSLGDLLSLGLTNGVSQPAPVFADPSALFDQVKPKNIL